MSELPVADGWSRLALTALTPLWNLTHARSSGRGSQLRDWSLITWRGREVLQKNSGGQVKLYPYKKREGRNVLPCLGGERRNKFWTRDFPIL